MKYAFVTSLAILSSLVAMSAQAFQFEIIKRLDDQQVREENGFNKGKLTYAQYQQLSANDNKVNMQFQLDTTANGGNLTRAEFKALNIELDKNSQLIKLDEGK